MSLQIVQNTTGYADPAISAVDTGWTVSGIYAIHASCNAGSIKNAEGYGMAIGRQYTITYVIDNYVSGQVYLMMGTTMGTPRTANGTYTETLTLAGNDIISFYSDGSLRLSELSIYDVENGLNEGTTITFHEGSNTWGSEKSFQPEVFIKFVNQFLSIKNGQLWLHNVNETRNNFYGVQYVSKVRFFDNVNPTTVKIYYSTRVQSNKRWACPGDTDIIIYPTEGRSLGMNSRLKPGNFNNYQGSFFADFLRNSIDPRFDDTLDALFKGEPLRGRILDVTYTNSDTVEVILFEIDIKSSPSAYTY